MIKKLLKITALLYLTLLCINHAIQANDPKKKIPFVNFNFSMKMDIEKYKVYKKVTEIYERFLLLKKNYHMNNSLQATHSKNPIIPKIIHQVWLGKKKIPEKFMRIRNKWLAMHPTWKYKIWTDANIKELFPLKNQKYFDGVTNLGEKSDILRLEILNKFGGFYVDIDYECLKPFDIFAHCYEFVVGLESLNISPYYIGNAIIGSIPNHPILVHCIKTIKHFRHLKTVPDRTGPKHLTRGFCKFSHLPRTIAFPTTYLYPMTCSERINKLKLEDYISPESFGIHYWSGTWKN